MFDLRVALRIDSRQKGLGKEHRLNAQNARASSLIDDR